MSNEQAASPEKDNLLTGAPPAKEQSALTGVEAEKSTEQSLAAGVTLELPHAWMEGLTKEQKADADLVKLLSKFEKGIPDLTRSYAELEKKLGQSFTIPNDGATPEELATFRKAIGTPEKPEDYKLEKVELPNNVEMDGEWEKELRALAHKLNLSQGQLESLHEWYFKNLAAEMQVVKTTVDEAEKALRKQMGAGYNEARAHMKRATDKFLTPEADMLFARSGLGNHPEILKMFLDIGKAMGEHFFAEGSPAAETEGAPFGARTDEELAEALYGKK